MTTIQRTHWIYKNELHKKFTDKLFISWRQKVGGFSGFTAVENFVQPDTARRICPGKSTEPLTLPRNK